MEQNESMDRMKTLRTAAIIAIAGNLVLALAKLAAGTITGSLAVLGDGIDSTTDVCISVLTLMVGFYINQPSDKEHPWGHRRAETLATLTVAFIIMYAGIQLFLSSLGQLFDPSPRQAPGFLALSVTLFSAAGKLLLAFSQYSLGKKAQSAIILANAKNMTNDILISASIFIGLGASKLFHLPFLDPLTALLVSVWVIRSAFIILKEQNLELMDGTGDDETYRSLFSAVTAVEGAGNPHRARIRKIGGAWDIDLDIEVEASLTVREAHDIAQKVEEEIRRRIQDVYDIMVHVEPAGCGEHDEQYGLTEKDLGAGC